MGEQAGLGSIYMCSHGGSRYGSNGCRRTYLSQRDLQAHIQHRHMKQQQSAFAGSTSAAASQNQLAQPNSHNSSNQLLVPTATQLPSAQEIAAATAAIVANRKRQEHQQHPAQSSTIASVTNMTQHSHPQTAGYQHFTHLSLQYICTSETPTVEPNNGSNTRQCIIRYQRRCKYSGQLWQFVANRTMELPSSYSCFRISPNRFIILSYR